MLNTRRNTCKISKFKNYTRSSQWKFTFQVVSLKIYSRNFVIVVAVIIYIQGRFTPYKNDQIYKQYEMTIETRQS